MRVAVLSDIHSNLVALDAVLGSIGSVDAVWHLGDVVGYGPEPDGVVERLRAAKAVGVRGNHDAAAVGGDEIEYFNVDARRAMEWTRQTISADTRAWLEALPERRTIGAYTLVHGSPRDPIWEYVVSPAVARENFAAFETVVCLHGHTHVPIAFREDGNRLGVIRPGPGDTPELAGHRSLVNPGSVGQPRDGIREAAYLVLDTETGHATWHRVAYDVRTTQEAMHAAGLPSRLANRLSFGL